MLFFGSADVKRRDREKERDREHKAKDRDRQRERLVADPSSMAYCRPLPASCFHSNLHTWLMRCICCQIPPYYDVLPLTLVCGWYRDRDHVREADTDRVQERPRDKDERARERDREHRRRMGVPESRIAEDERHKAKQVSLHASSTMHCSTLNYCAGDCVSSLHS